MGENMIILFAERNSKTEKEIIEILTSFGVHFISAKQVLQGEKPLTLISLHKPTQLDIKKGVVIFCDDTGRFSSQRLPKTVLGICEEDCNAALNVFKNSGVAVISCGLCSKNTVTVSSISKNQLLIAFQRSFINLKGEVIEPREFQINLRKTYNTYSVLAAATALILNSIIPEII